MQSVTLSVAAFPEPAWLMRKPGAQKFIAGGMFNKGTVCLHEVVLGFMVFGQCVSFILIYVKAT